MGNREFIIEKINKIDRSGIVYFHPVISLRKITEYVTAFANSDGGIIVFGVKDDGNRLIIKSSAFEIKKMESAIRELIDASIKFHVGSFMSEEKSKIEYIVIEKNRELVAMNGDIYIIKNSSRKIEKMVQKKLFLSYCQKDNCIANIIEKEISHKAKGISISRDIRDVKYKESFSKFMQTIGEHDFVISVVSHKYLKSRNCMYEITETMRDRKYDEKLLYVVVSDKDIIHYSDQTLDIKADIYSISGQTEYIKYWQAEEKQLEQLIETIADPLLIGEHVEELKVIKKIQIEIQEFMRLLRDRKGISLQDMIDSKFNDMMDIIL